MKSAIIAFPVTSDLSFNGKKLSTLTKVMNGSGALIKNTDYSVTDNTLVIKKSYISYYFNKFPGYTLKLTTYFNDKSIDITIKPTVS